MNRHLGSLATMIGLVAMVFAPAQADEHEHHAKPAHGAETGASMPFARLADDGRLHIAFVDAKDGVKTVRYRQLFGTEIIECAVTAPGHMLTHWPESPPLVEVTRDGGIHVLYSVRTGDVDKNGGSPIELRVATSTDGGRAWAPYRVVGDAARRVYRACASMREDAQGGLVISWLEGRPDGAAVDLKTGVLWGDRFEHATAVEKVCECCATELTRAGDGAMWLAYRGVDENSVRDLFLARMMPEADRFGPSARISRDRWMIPGCPDSGPRFTLAAEDAVWVAWYSGNPRGIYASRATVRQPQFAARELVQGADEQVFSVAHPAIGTLPDGRVLIAYECKRDEADGIEGRVRAGSGWSDPVLLGGKGEYPRIAANGRKAYLVYTAIADGQKSIEVRDLAEAFPEAR